MLSFIWKILKKLKLGQTLLLLMLLALVIVLPRISTVDSGKISGSIILWHTWEDVNAEALKASIESFQTIYPDVKIILSSYTSEEIFERVLQSTSLGFGPDIILAPQSLLESLIENELITPIHKQISTTSYIDDALQSVRFQDELYGLPVSLYTKVLYYNKTLVSKPVETIDSLTSAFESGQTFGIGSDYNDLVWGVTAFGGQLFDSEGKSVLDQGALSNWLSWLQSQQELPQFYLDENLELLRMLFVTKSLSYFVDSSRQLPYLRTELGEELGVTNLPSGPGGKAQPLLDSDVLYISRSTSEQQQNQAVTFGLFLGNREQQRRLLREARHVPVNRDVSIDNRFNPIIHAVDKQVEQSLVNSTDENFRLLERLADNYFRQVIEGVISAEMGAQNLSDAINNILGFSGGTSEEMTPE